MRAGSPWKILGIEETADRRAVKRAYATKLKAIDPDKEPETFLALRRALEAVLWQIDYVDPDDADDVVATIDGAAFDADDQHDGIAANFEYPDDPEAQMRQRLAAILLGEEPIEPLETEARELAQSVISAAEARSIEVSAQTESWLAWIAANTIRRSDCIIPLLVHSYNWKHDAGTIHASMAQDALLNRHSDLFHVHAMQRPEHPDYDIFRRLSEAVSGPPNIMEKMLYGASVRNFIYRMRTTMPTVEWELDADTIAHWESAVGRNVSEVEQLDSGKFSWYFWLLLAIFILTILRVAFA